MYIRKIKIDNFRNFNDFTIEFNKGLNVIVGANNSGKTGLLYAIRLLKDLSISIHDFNKNNLLKYSEKYKDDAPKITLEFTVYHEIKEDDTEDESIIKLLPFLGIDEITNRRNDEDGQVVYNLVAQIKMVYALDPKFLSDYKIATQQASDFDTYFTVLEQFLDNYDWSVTNGMSEITVEKGYVKDIFDIQLITAERTKEEIVKETKKEIDKFVKENKDIGSLQDIKKGLSEQLKDFLKPALEKLTNLFENERNEIGLLKGNVAISQSIQPKISISDFYVNDIKDTKAGYILPLEYNGLGYNNLISIYILIKLAEIRQGKDFKILCLEEPEAHLHPAMQYKLFKYLHYLDVKNELNQQIFVTTHSSNISAVAGLDNMIMLAYNRNGNESSCEEQSLRLLFQEKDASKKHLSKFLDVTRSDMLFADKVILVEGLAERLLLPRFMDKLGLSYEDEHISIVEIGGKHFDHFIELFNGNKVIKKVLCFTDNDYLWEDDANLEKYSNHEASHIKKLREKFQIENFCVFTQKSGGSTFEDELFLANEGDVLRALLKLSTSDVLYNYLESNEMNYSALVEHINQLDGRVQDKFKTLIAKCERLIENDQSNREFYEKLFLAKLFLEYAKNKKGDVALGILTNDDLWPNINVPTYIKEGLEWLLR